MPKIPHHGEKLAHRGRVSNCGAGRGTTLRDVAMPAVGDNDVLVRVRAASVHPDI
jgi:NADPH:quinone reductase-like Zn-dependent oxidoreductase